MFAVILLLGGIIFVLLIPLYEFLLSFISLQAALSG